jgi:hypothetical protein
MLNPRSEQRPDSDFKAGSSRTTRREKDRWWEVRDPQASWCA